jgi:hypothetical protein
VEKFSDFSSAEETDTDIPVNTDVLKLFDSENEMEESFLGFEKDQCNEASNPTMTLLQKSMGYPFHTFIYYLCYLYELPG